MTVPTEPCPRPVWLACPEAPEEDASPEFRYLKGLVTLHARRTWGDVRWLAPPTGPSGPGPADNDLIVILASARVLLGQATMVRMADLMRTGAAAACPVPLATALGATGRAAFTLAGIEQVEQAILGKEHRLPHSPGATPAVLLRWGDLQRVTGGAGPAAAFADLRSPGGWSLTPREPAGLAHEFIDYYGEVRRDILPFIPPTARRVLEVGCGRGVTGALLKQELGVSVTGVELNPVVARAAAEVLDEVICGDIEGLPLAGEYDVVLALELFEHLVDPGAFLTRVRALVRPGGAVILSTPNVGHYSVAMDLARGRWDYLPIGLLCLTHLRFFTRRTLEDWLEMEGCTGYRLVPQTTPLPAEVRRWALRTGGDLESLATTGFYVVVPV